MMMIVLSVMKYLNIWSKLMVKQINMVLIWLKLMSPTLQKSMALLTLLHWSTSARKCHYYMMEIFMMKRKF
ncbi:hypothetical protein L9F63_025156, partial [Diploptera punctata]